MKKYLRLIEENETMDQALLNEILKYFSNIIENLIKILDNINKGLLGVNRILISNNYYGEVSSNIDIDKILKKNKNEENLKNNEKLNKFQPEVNYHPELVDFDSLEDLSAIKVFFTHEKHSKLIELRDQILENHMGLFSHAFSLPLCLEFMDKSVDKSVAIAKILEKENFVFQEAISFGDGYNDENMLKSSGKGLVMGNAPDSLKDKLSHLEVISTNDNEGVAKYIAEQLLNS